MALMGHLALVLCLFPVVAEPEMVEFIYNGFNESQNISLEGASIVKPGGALRLTTRSNHVIGHAFYANPLQMFDERSNFSPGKAASFSTSFVFAIVTPGSRQGGYGLAFALAPSPKFPGAAAEHYLGLFNSSNVDDPSNHIFAVEFDTVNGYKEDKSTKGNHVGININGVLSVQAKPASYLVDGTDREEDMELDDGNPIQAWIEYDGEKKQVNVTICPLDKAKPAKPLISRSVDLADYVKATMYVGFSASTGRESSSHYILGWSFSMDGKAAPQLNLSQLPVPPKERDPSLFNPQIIALIASLSVVTLLLLGVLGFFTRRNMMKWRDDIEDWELDCPHRFRYKDLHVATKGFKHSEVIGIGGFGAVYRGVLAVTGTEVAVKKIMRNSIQGMREFAAEIESLGRLRHKNLVNFQGWCKQNNDLLLVYEYIPNGSLDSLLFDPEGDFVLSWEQRFNIIKGIGAGLLYLHEEWEQVVIHRDVKSGNVLIDSDMNARLGDFGLARLCDHGKISHTTNVVGTIGYIAPELARTGRASTSTDVFAFGVLLLEVASGRRPIDSGPFILVDWVMELHQMGGILGTVDTRLKSSYVVEEMELVLVLGLLCSHSQPELRPNMRKVMRYLNRDDALPMMDTWSSIDSRRAEDICSRFLEATSPDMITTSYLATSFGGMSTSSVDAGR